MQQKLSDLQIEERMVTAQLSWKNSLEEDPVLVNGSAEEQQQEDQPEELRVEPPASQPQMEPAELMEEVDEDRPKTPEEPEPKSDAFEDLYNSLSSTVWPVPQDNLVKAIYCTLKYLGHLLFVLKSEC